MSVWKEGAGQRDSASVAAQVVGEGYFRTLGTPLVRGREFTVRDGRGASPVAIVNQKLAREFTDPTVWLIVATVLALTMTAATWLPSRRASRIDPAAALQCD